MRLSNYKAPGTFICVSSLHPLSLFPCHSIPTHVQSSSLMMPDQVSQPHKITFLSTHLKIRFKAEMAWKRKFRSDIYRCSISLDFSLQKDHYENLCLATCKVFGLSVLLVLMLIDALPVCPVPSVYFTFRPHGSEEYSIAPAASIQQSED